MAKAVGKPTYKCPACGKMVRKTTKGRLEQHKGNPPMKVCLYSGQPVHIVESVGKARQA